VVADIPTMNWKTERIIDDLLPGWVEATTPSTDDIYYYNAETENQAQERPTAVVTPTRLMMPLRGG
jgi:hypothetical protein